MIVEETFFRRAEVSRESRHLAAETYNLAHILRKRAGSGCLFVPIRAMQYLAVLDEDEFIFVDREGGRFIELAWREFRPQARGSLAAPVAYQAVYYSPAAPRLMGRLHSEFARALKELESRQVPAAGARVIRLDTGGR